MKELRNFLGERFGEVVPRQVVDFIFSKETQGMTCADVRKEIDKRWPKVVTPKDASTLDMTEVLRLAHQAKAEREGPDYTDDSDMPQHIYEAVMEAVFPGYFAWCRTL